MSQKGRVFAIIGGLTGWGGLIIQFWLSMTNTTYPTLTTIINYFSFFTILTNILVAVTFTCLVFGVHKGFFGFFTRQSTLTATTVHITIVGVIFNVILRPEIHSTGLQAWISDVLHVATPILFIAYWVLYVPKHYYSWSSIIMWLIYPIVYLIYTLVRGPIADFYPYPFVDVRLWGMAKVLESCGIITVVYILFAVGFNHLSRFLARKQGPQKTVI